MIKLTADFKGYGGMHNIEIENNSEKKITNNFTKVFKDDFTSSPLVNN